MSRQMLEVTLKLSDGKVLKGIGRNLPATCERIYNENLQPNPRKFVTITEQFKQGFVQKGENRYEGTFHATFAEKGAERDSGGVVVVEVKHAVK